MHVWVLSAMGVVLIVLGAVVCLLPTKTRKIEHSVSSARLEATIPTFWQGRQTTRVRVVGALLIFAGILLIFAAFFGR
jgi:uncharacterized membrane protein HdeD (DUF308 family)